MSDAASHEQIEAARAYEDLHVGALFREWAPRVVQAAEIRPGDRVLDVACGTGVLAREVLAHVGSGGRVAGLDASPGMLAVAEQLAPAIEWRQGTADALPYPAGSFDAIVSQFGLMFFPDRRAALSEMVRVVVPGGRLAVAVWDALERSPVYPSWVGLLERAAGVRAADALRAPFVLGDRDELRALFVSAGVDAVAIRSSPGTARFPSIRAMAEADLRGWLPLMGVRLPEAQIADILGEADRIFDPHRTASGGFVFDSPAHIVIGRRQP